MSKRFSVLLTSPNDQFNPLGAETKRSLNLAKGLLQLNCDARILFRNTSNSPHHHWHPFWGDILCSQIINKKSSTLKESWLEGFKWAYHDFSPDVVICYGNNPLRWCKLIAKFCRQHRIRILGDYTEWYPFRKAPRGALMDRLFLKYGVTTFNGMIVISRFLQTIFAETNIPVIRIPAMTYDKPIITCVRSPKPNSIVTYIGKLSERDRPDALLNGFHNAIKNGFKGILRIIGKPVQSSAYNQFNNILSNRNSLKNAVQFTGFLSEQELENSMRETDIFVLPREKSSYADACFPTRLPEMLATGKPVIVANIGDLGEYLDHKINIWFIRAGNYPTDISDALIFLQNNPLAAHTIGCNGAYVASQQFSGTEHAAKLIDFIDKL